MVGLGRGVSWGWLGDMGGEEGRRGRGEEEIEGGRRTVVFVEEVLCFGIWMVVLTVD